jgi:hypothetical protein
MGRTPRDCRGRPRSWRRRRRRRAPPPWLRRYEALGWLGKGKKSRLRLEKGIRVLLGAG